MTSYINKLSLLGKEISLFDKHNRGKSRNCKVLVDRCYLLNNKIVIVLKNEITKKYEVIQRNVNQNIINTLSDVRMCSIEYSSCYGVQFIDLGFNPNTVMDNNVTTILCFGNGNIMAISDYDNFSFCVYNTKEIGKIIYIVYIVGIDRVRIIVNEKLRVFDITHNGKDKTIVLDDEIKSIYHIRPVENMYSNIVFSEVVGEV